MIEEHDVEAMAPLKVPMTFREWAEWILANMPAKSRYPGGPMPADAIADIINEDRRQRNEELWRRAQELRGGES